MTRDVVQDSTPATGRALEVGDAHLVVRLPEDPADIALVSPILDAAERSDRWRRVTVLVPFTSASMLAEHAGGTATSGGSEIVRIGGERDERAAYERLTPDATVLLDHGRASAWQAWRARVPLRAGLAVGGRRWLLTHGVAPPSDGGSAHRVPLAHLARDVGGLVGLAPASLHPRIDVAAERFAAAASRLADLGLGEREPYVICAPGAARGAGALWPADYYGEVLAKLERAKGWRPLLLAHREDHASGLDAVLAHAPASTLRLVCSPNDLGELPALVGAAVAWIGGARAPAALAAAAGIPCISLAGPDDRRVRTPVSARAAALSGSALECAPCERELCPLGHARCLSDLAILPVLELLETLLEVDDEEAEFE